MKRDDPKINALSTLKKPRTDDKKLWDIILGNAGQRTILIAHELKLFPFLAEKPRSLAEICEELKIEDRPARAILGVLVGLEILNSRDGCYSLATIAEDYLLDSSTNSFCGMLDFMLANQYVTFSYEGFKKAVLTNSPQLYQSDHPFENHKETEALARIFTHGMHGHSIAPALAWPEVLDLSKHKLMLDIGGGSGAHAIGAIWQWPNLEAIIFEQPPICPVAQEFIEHYGVQDQVKTCSGDMWQDPFPDADIHFYSDIFHDWLPEKGRYLTRKSFDSLPSCGRIIIHEMLFDERKTSPLTVASYNLAMQVVIEGQQYSGEELIAMLQESGFIEVEVKATFGYWSIVTGCKP